jgi:hypothetical protein
LGPILSKNDVDNTSLIERNSTPESIFRSVRANDTDMKSIGSNIMDGNNNPFAIQTIKKPLMSQLDAPGNKIVIKSTFESLPGEEPVEEAETRKSLDSGFKIQPYQPLRFRSP